MESSWARASRRCGKIESTAFEPGETGASRESSECNEAASNVPRRVPGLFCNNCGVLLSLSSEANWTQTAGCQCSSARTRVFTIARRYFNTDNVIGLSGTQKPLVIDIISRRSPSLPFKIEISVGAKKRSTVSSMNARCICEARAANTC